MILPVIHSTLGPGVLTTEHAASSYGQPVFVTEDGTAYGTGDAPHSFLMRPAAVQYDAEQEAWLRGLLEQPDTPIKWRWRRPGGGRKAQGEESLTEAVYLRLAPSQAEWLTEHGGPAKLREMIDRERGA